MIGRTISHYRIIDKLGEGGMGVVYKAHDTSLDRLVALKFLPSYLTSDPAEKERFYHEARAASSLNHPNITVIHEIAEFEGQLYMAMELVEGRTLKQLAQQDLPSLKKTLDIAIQVCEGLSAAEEKKIVHRDIKSDNLMLTPKGQVKIMDFGLAKVKGSTKLTRAGSTLGTAAYMSPEQAQGEEVDHRSDIFSFGVVLYELLTGNLPFRGEHHAAMMYSLVHEDPLPIPRFNTAVSPELERIVAKALEKDRGERYQHIDDMLADLRRERKNFEYAKAGYVRSTASLPAMPPPATGKKYRKYLIAALAIVAVLVVLIVFNPFNFQITTQRSHAAGPGRTSLAVLYFQNIADPLDKDHIGDMLADLLITSLSQSRDVEVISRERLYDIQKELQADAKTISPDMASKVARRAGVTTMLLGSIVQLEPVLMVTTRLIDVESGRILNSQRVTGYSQKQIFGLVDTLSLLVEREIAGTEPSPEERKSVADVTTSSPEAYRSYVEGVELNNKFFYAEAYAAFRQAIELDSNFAMAYFGLATANGELDFDARRVAIKHAWRLRQNVTEVERLAIESVYAGYIENNLEKAAGILETVVQKYPLNHAAYASLAAMYGRLWKPERAREIIRSGLHTDSLDKSLWNSLAYISALLDDRHSALPASDRYLGLAPAEPNPYDSRGDISMIFGDADSAIYWWQRAVSFRPDFPSSQKLGLQSLLRGDYDASEKYFTQAVRAWPGLEKVFSEEMAGFTRLYRGQLKASQDERLRLLPSRAYDRLRFVLVIDYAFLAWTSYELGNPQAMLEYARKRSAELKKDPANVFYGRDLLAIASARAGDRTTATNLLTDLHREIDTTEIENRIRLVYAAALVAFEEGDYAASLDAFQRTYRLLPPNHAPLYFHALCLLKVGKPSDAASEFRRLDSYSPIHFWGFDLDFLPSDSHWPISAAKAHYWLGVAYEQQGKNSGAMAEYRKFLQIWKDADFKSRELDDAKARLAKLQGTASR